MTSSRNVQAQIEHDAVSIAFRDAGDTNGAAVVLLHGAMGNGEDWDLQIPFLVDAGYRVIAIDSRGHGRSTRDARPFDYEIMAHDVIAVLDALDLSTAAVVGWSDGAILGLILGMRHPERVKRVFAFGANMDLTGVKSGAMVYPTVTAAFDRAATSYARLSPTPNDFSAFSRAVTEMTRTQPNYAATDLAGISVPVTIASGEDDEFITREHTEYLARSIRGSDLLILPGVTHFAPLQNPSLFNEAMRAFLSRA